MPRSASRRRAEGAFRRNLAEAKVVGHAVPPLVARADRDQVVLFWLHPSKSLLGDDSPKSAPGPLLTRDQCATALRRLPAVIDAPHIRALGSSHQGMLLSRPGRYLAIYRE